MREQNLESPERSFLENGDNPGCGSPTTAVEVSHLSRRFGAKTALNNVSITLGQGQVFGLLGANGAGKTTLIKHILGLLTPQKGSVRVFKMNPVTEYNSVLQNVGYLSEFRDLPKWMRIDELIRYTRTFYQGWDASYAKTLKERFSLDGRAHVKNLSRGETAKLALMLALAHRPKLLLLDEPSSGLDPIVREDILEAILRSIAEEGRTVLFSSHLLEEVDRVADHVAILAEGRVVLDGQLRKIKQSHQKMLFRFNDAQSVPRSIDMALSVVRADRDLTIICGEGDSARTHCETMGGILITESQPTLADLFNAYAKSPTKEVIS